MKKLVLVFVSLMAGTLSAYAQDFRISAGVGGLFESNRLTFFRPALFNGGITTPYLGFSAFLDLTYAEISLGYAAQAAVPIYSEDFASNQNLAVNTHSGFLNIRAVGKYPLQLLRGLVIFPLIGIEYDILVADDSFGSMTNLQKSDTSDFFLVFGVGTDIDLTDSIYVRFTVDYDLNLTTTPFSAVPNETYGGYKISTALSVGFRF